MQRKVISNIIFKYDIAKLYCHTKLIENCSKWVIDRSYRKMTSISMWAKERPYKRSWQDDQLLRRFKLKQKLSSSLLFVMITTWILECLQTLLIWGKILSIQIN